MKGVILAAGKGSRLYPITHHIPKPLLPLANRPTMHYAFDRMKEVGVVDICVVVGENEPYMREALGDGSDYGIKLDYVRQTEPKGLAHALGFTEKFIDGDNFMMYLGDGIYGEGFFKQAERFKESGAANLNIVKEVPDPSSFGIAFTDGERITKVVEKPKNPETNLALTGCYFFGPQIFEVIPDLKPSGRGEYEITDAIQLLVDRGDMVLTGVYNGAWFDSGTLDSFLEVSAFLVNGETNIHETAEVDAAVGVNVVIGAGAKVKCDYIEDAVIFPGAVVDVRGDIRHSMLAERVDSAAGLIGTIRYGTEA